MSRNAHPLVALQIEDGVATLSLDRADKRNALNADLMKSIAGALDAVRDDPAARVVVLRGNGPIFSSGIDHGFLMQVFAESQSVPFKHLHHDLQDVFHRMERMEKPIIAAVHRGCVGMALELALACDFRIATADCVLGLPEIAFGIVPDVGGTTRLIRLVGQARARELILTGRLVRSSTAERLGLVNEVVADEAALIEATARWASMLKRHSPVVVGMAKSLILQSADLNAAMSFQLEGVVQQVLMKQPDLGERFAGALQFIREQMADPQ